MPTNSSTRTVTLRLPNDLYDKTAQLALQKHMSLNALLQEGAQRLLQQEEERELSAGFDLLAEHPDECDVEYAIYAQAEVMLHDEA
jgi:hypothetical protein